MAANEGSSADSIRQLERLETKLNEAEQAAAGVKSASRIMSVIFVVVIFGMLLILFRPLVGIYRNPAPIGERVFKEMQSTVVPRIEEEARKLANEVVPVVQKTAEDVANKRRAEIMKTLENEYALLFTNLQDQISTLLVESSAELAEKQYTRLVKEFPEIEQLDAVTDPKHPDTRKAELIIGSLDAVSQRLATEFFETHFDGLAQLEIEFNSFEADEEIAAMSDDELQDLASRLAVEYFAKRLDQALDSGTVTTE